MFFVPAILATIVTCLFVFGWTLYRGYLYDKFDKVASSETSTLVLADEFIESKEYVKEVNGRAISGQNKFQTSLSFALGLLFSAFIIFAMTVCYYDMGEAFLQGAYLTEAMCMAVALFLVWRSNLEKLRWLSARTRAELARRSSFTLVGLNIDATSSLVEQTKRRDEKTHRRLSETSLESFKLIADSDLELLSAEVMQIRTSERRLEDYRVRRVFRQLHWFHQSEKRMLAQIRHRSKLLLAAFVMVSTLTLLKAVDANHDDFDILTYSKSHLTFAILACTGLTIVAGSFYFNTGIGALRARYQRQSDLIEELLRGEGFSLDRVRQFEELMNNELKFFLEGIGSEGIEISV